MPTATVGAACSKCGTLFSSGDETCPECGELTPYGLVREQRVRRRANRRHSSQRMALWLILALILVVGAYLAWVALTGGP